jgi:hypothetical protein
MTLCSTSIALSRSSSIPILLTTTTTTTKPPTKKLQRRKGAKTPNPKTSLQNPKTPFKAFLWSFNIPSKSQNPFQGLIMVF